MRLFKRTIFFTLACVMLCGAVALGQATSGTISGTMLDPQGNVLAGATVKVKNLGTGVTREVTSNGNGVYRVAGLPPGRYEVEAAAQGFANEKRGELSLTVAEEIVVNFSLKIGVQKQDVTVEVQSVNVETTGSTVSGLVDERKVRDLPLNGRDLAQLVLLQPGVVNSRSSQQTANTGRGLRFSVGGARPSQNLFQLDGTIINDALNNTPGSSQGLLVGVETVKEFRVLTNTFSAEYGRVAGGVFVAVTKSGTNEFHGSVFDFLRNDNMDARNFFDRCTTSVTCDGGGKPEFRRNQFGGAIGGPVVKDKTFFFFSYEGLREFKGITTIATVPSASGRQGILPGGNVTVDPNAQALLNLFPAANGVDNGDGTAQFIGVTNRIARDDFATIKIDHQLSSSDSLSGRYLFDDSTQILPGVFPQYPNQALNRKQVGTLEYRKFIGANIVNEARFGFNRSTPRELVIIPTGGGNVSLIQGQPLGTVEVNGLSPIGTDRTNPKLFYENNYQVSDNLFFTLGRQNIRVGGIYERFQFNGRAESRTRGRLRYNSLSDLLTLNGLDLEGSSQGSDFVRGFRQNLFGAFVQDDFKITPRLTLNLGLRYEFVTSPEEVNGKTANLRNIIGTSNNPTDLGVGDTFFETPKGGIAPRFGFAYDVFGDGKTALRGGFGIYYEQPLFSSYRQAAYGTLPFIQTQRVRIRNVPGTIPQLPPSAFGSGTPLTETLAFDLQEIYVMQYNLNVQREFLGAVLSAGYVGSRGVNLLGQGDINTSIGQVQPDGRVLFDGNRRNPNFDIIRSGIQGFNSWYNSMNLGAARRFNQGFQFQLSYTFGKSIDERSGISGRQEFLNGQSRTLDPYNRTLDKARSDFDVRHSFVANATYDLPFGKYVSGRIPKYILDGWQVNSIVTVSSGVPFGVTVDGDPDNDGTDENAARPDLIAGAPLYPAGGSTPDLWFDPTAFIAPQVGFRGTAGRNILVGPNFRSVDLGMTKLFKLNEKQSLQFRVEAFNLFNRANFDLPANVDDGSQVFDANFNLSPNVGRIFQTVPLQQGDAREFQIALKFLF
jgi:carboxypeptidase family protein/TonB-dependent receptor-like protein